MKEDEQVLVIPSQLIFEKGSWQGIKKDDVGYYLELIKSSSLFKRRGDVEEDDSFQQIIPYIIFSFQNKFFLYKYIKEAGEKRLIDHYQLAVGGHINSIDGKNLEKAAMREWEEEVNFQGKILSKKVVGILNDERRMVEKVHLGIIYHFIGDNDNILIKETNKLEGEMVEKEKIAEAIKGSDGWAPIVWHNYISQL